MPAQLHPLITHDEIRRMVSQLIQLHRPDIQQQGSVLTLDQSANLSPSITSSTVLKGSYITDLFGEHLKIEPSFEKVSGVNGYPFDVIVAYPPYDNWFPESYPLPNNLPTDVLFMYLALQLLQTDGLLITVFDADRSDWPEDQIYKMCRLIDTYPLPAAFGQPTESEILVYRKKPTDAVRYEESL